MASYREAYADRKFTKFTKKARVKDRCNMKHYVWRQG